MQLANSMEEDSSAAGSVRYASRRDAAAVQKLLRMGVYVHIHIDWRLPGEWLSRPGFVVYDRDGHSSNTGKNFPIGDGSPSEIIGCMAVAAEPLPAAWVRVAAVDSVAGFAQAEAMFAAILADLDPAINEIAWFLTDYWPLHWLERLGFRPVSNVISYRKEGLSVPAYTPPAGLEIRPLLMEDIPALAAMEEAAFEPRWRHSGDDLFLAWRYSLSFTVALLDGEPVAFQLSTGGEGNAHLSRMTVHPNRQGLGIGAALLADTMKGYRLQNIATVTLNTQSDNRPSQRLYERFGFVQASSSYPVWSYFPKS